MAGPAQLIQAVSVTTGVPLPTVTDIDRRLVKVGLRSKGGRGRSAANMTPLDAARLLTAILAAPQATLSVEAVTRYAETKPDKTRSTDGLFRQVELDDLSRLPARHGFVDALAALIASVSTGSLHRLMAKVGKGWQLQIEVFAFTRATWGRIRLAGLPNGLTASLEYRPTKSSGHVATTAHTGDLEQSRRITAATILPVARLLSEEG